MLNVRLGAGAMGVVYSAHDRKLGREVAIKLLHPGAAGRHARRLLREARTLARLAHPNVVPVFDVGWANDDVFVAMELVRGHSLDQEIARTRPPLARVVGWLLEAGRGLEHAHRAGVIHRDFKPANVLIGADGRARVADFGLARPISEPSSADDDDDREPSSQGPRGTALELCDEPMTRPGETPGTPAYMAPESLRDGHFDERSDQFAFCVSAWEVLFGSRPQRDPSDGGVIPTSRRRSVPGSIRAALLKGMASSPEARHRSMTDLLRRLRPTHRARAMLAIAASAIAVGVYVTRDRAPCPGIDRETAEVWNDERAEALGTRYAAIAPDDDDTLVRSVVGGFAGYADAVAQMGHDACVAHHVEQTQSDSLFDQRMVCVASRRTALSSLVEVLLADSSREVLLGAPDAIARLPPVRSCGDVDSLATKPWHPQAPQERAQAMATELQLAHARALVDTGQYVAALPALHELVRGADALPDSPLRAASEHLSAVVSARMGDEPAAFAGLERASTAAAAARDDEILLSVWLDLLSLLASHADRRQEFATVAGLVESMLTRVDASAGDRARLLECRARSAVAVGQVDEAVAHGLAAVALVEDAGGDPLLLARVHGSAGLDLQAAGRYAEAAAHFEAAIASSSQVLGATHPQIGNDLVNLALVQPPEQAEASLERAVAILRNAFPGGHSDVGRALANLGLAQLNRGAFAEAEPTLVEARTHLHAAHPNGHPHLARTLAVTADLLNELGRREEALAAAEESLTMMRGTLPAEHPEIGRVVRLVGSIFHDMGDCARAVPRYEEALALMERALSADHPLIAGPLNGIGECSIEQANPARALQTCGRALQLEQAAHGSDALELGPHLSCLGRAHAALGDDQSAIDRLEAVVTLWTTHDVGPLLLAQVELELASVLDRVGRDPQRVVKLASHVLEVCQANPLSRGRLCEPAAALLGATSSARSRSAAVGQRRP